MSFSFQALVIILDFTNDCLNLLSAHKTPPKLFSFSLGVCYDVVPWKQNIIKHVQVTSIIKLMEAFQFAWYNKFKYKFIAEGKIKVMSCSDVEI